MHGIILLNTDKEESGTRILGNGVAENALEV